LEDGRHANASTAGGKAINSKMDRMLEVVPEHIHDRSGIFMGSEEEVQKVVDAHKKYQK
jgi:fructose-1,6-bisphosphatase I